MVSPVTATSPPVRLRRLLPDADRIHHVPGIALRRAIFLCDLPAVRVLQELQHDATIAPMLTTSLCFLDLMFVRRADLEMMYGGFSIRERLDHVVAAATLCDRDCLQWLMRRRTSESEDLPTRLVKVVQAACALNNDRFILWMDEQLDRTLDQLDWNAARMLRNTMSALNLTRRRDTMSAFQRTRRRDWDMLPPPDFQLVVSQLSARWPSKHEKAYMGYNLPLDQQMTAVPPSPPRDKKAPHSENQKPQTKNHTIPRQKPINRRKKIITRPPRALDAAMAVLTCEVLMCHIGSFQYTYTNIAEAEGVLVHHAIINNDIHALNAMYIASRRMPRESEMIPKLRFRLAMHVAACEGRLEILQWLHARSLQYPHEIFCRPDTMAMAVRCGWAHVVEWLHLNRPESTKSMSELAINDAAKWGHVGVLRVCHTYKLAKFTTTAMRLAARAGHVEVVKWLHSIEDHALSVHAAIDTAILYGRVDVVRYFRDDCRETIKEPHLTLSLRSSAPLADNVLQLLWTGRKPSDPEAQRVVRPKFAQICAARSEAIVALVLPFMDNNVSAIIAGMEAAAAAGRHAIVELILRLCCEKVLHEIFQHALRHAQQTVVSACVSSGRLSAYDLATTYRLLLAGDKSIAFTSQEFFQVAGQRAAPYPINELQALGAATTERESDALHLVRDVVMPIEKRHRRGKHNTIAALNNTTALEVVAFLLSVQPAFCDERVVLDSAPACVKPQLMRYLLYRSEQSTALATTVTATAATTTTEANKKPNKTTRETTFADITRQVGGFLTVDEVERIEAAKSDELNARLKQDHRDLLAPTFLVDASRVKKFHLFAYIHNVLALTDLTDEAVVDLLYEVKDADGLHALVAVRQCPSDIFDTANAVCRRRFEARWRAKSTLPP